MMEKVVVVVLLLFAGPAQANDNDNETVAIYGMGNTSCGTYVLALNENLPSVGLQWRGKHYYSNSAALWQWISGYISARNLAVPSDYQLKTDNAGIWQWLRKHCDANPTISLLRAANDLLVLMECPGRKIPDCLYGPSPGFHWGVAVVLEQRGA